MHIKKNSSYSMVMTRVINITVQIIKFAICTVILSTFFKHGITIKFLKSKQLCNSNICTGVLTSPQSDQKGNKLGSMSGTRANSTTSRRELSTSSIFGRQGGDGNSRNSDRNISLFVYLQKSCHRKKKIENSFTMTVGFQEI